MIKNIMANNLTNIFLVFIFASATFLVKNVFVRKFLKKLVEKTSTTFDNEILPLLNSLVNILIFVTSGTFILHFLGVDVKGLLTTLGASSLIIAYGFKDSLTNIICGLVIKAHRPFRVGDSIKLPSGELVEVLDIGSSRSKFFDDEQNGVIIVPNIDLCKSKIVNYTYGEDLVNEANSYEK